MTKVAFPLLALLAAALVAPPAGATACPPRIAVSYGDTLSAIAAACGVSVESIRLANPGLSARTLRAGVSIAIPRPALPSPQGTIGHPSVLPMPPLVPPSVGGGGSATVILPPPPVPVPQQHILRGFGDQPGQLPLPPGHGSPFPPLR
jgi:LysM repeat protein